VFRVVGKAPDMEWIIEKSFCDDRSGVAMHEPLKVAEFMLHRQADGFRE
jgi:hypothetical protein